MDSSPVVVDASVAICIVLGEPRHLAVQQALYEWASDDRRIVVPAQFWMEVVNRLSREAGMTGAGFLGAVHHLDTYGLETIDIDRPLVLHVIDLVERFRLTAYDALYLAVAESLDAELATLDRTLATAAGDRAVRIGDDHRLQETPAAYERDVTWPRYKGAGAYLAKLRAEVMRGDERDRAAPALASRPRVALRGAGSPPVDAQLDDIGDMPLERVEDPSPARVDVHLL